MPIGPYATFDECVIKNSDKASPQGYCAWLEHQITGSWPGQNQSGLPDEAWEIFRGAYSDSMLSSSKQVEEADKDANEYALESLGEKGWHYSRIGWVKDYAAPKFRTAMGVRIFAVGTWTDSAGVSRDWTEADVDGLVAAFNAGVPGNVPLKCGHTPDTFNLKIAEKLGIPVEVVTGDHGNGQIAVGGMATLERRGTLLMASFERVPEQIADLIEAGLYSTVSVEIEDDIGGYSSAITAVALLGAEEPAVDEATLDRALVFGGKRDKAHVLTFAKDADYLEREFTTLTEKVSETIKGMRGAPVFRALMSNLRTLFNQITKKRGEHEAPSDYGEVPPEIQAYADANFQGNVDALIRWAGGVGFDQCVAHLTGKEGIADPERLCGWLKAKSGVHEKTNKEAEMPEKLTIKEMKAKFQEPPPEGEAPPEGTPEGEVMDGLMAIAQALGLNEDATIEDILAAIAALKEAPAGEEAKFQKATTDLSKANDRITKLEHNERVHGYLEQVRLFSAIPNKTSTEIAEELADIEESRGKEKADSMLKTYQDLDVMGVAATKVLGTSVKGGSQEDYESKLSEYMKEHPEETRAQAQKAVMKAHPGLRYQAQAEEKEKVEK